jgi:hypothetical protein
MGANKSSTFGSDNCMELIVLADIDRSLAREAGEPCAVQIRVSRERFELEFL